MNIHHGCTARNAYNVALALPIVCAVAVAIYLPVSEYQEDQRFRLMQQVVAAIQNGTLRPDQRGDIVLPRHLARTTANGRVYLCRDRKQPFILFPDQVHDVVIEWRSGLPPQGDLPDQHNLQIAGYIYSKQEIVPQGWAVKVDDPNVEQVFVGHLPERKEWYYAEPWND